MPIAMRIYGYLRCPSSCGNVPVDEERYAVSPLCTMLDRSRGREPQRKLRDDQGDWRKHSTSRQGSVRGPEGTQSSGGIGYEGHRDEPATVAPQVRRSSRAT